MINKNKSIKNKNIIEYQIEYYENKPDRWMSTFFKNKQTKVFYFPISDEKDFAQKAKEGGIDFLTFKKHFYFPLHWIVETNKTLGTVYQFVVHVVSSLDR